MENGHWVFDKYSMQSSAHSNKCMLLHMQKNEVS